MQEINRQLCDIESEAGIAHHLPAAPLSIAISAIAHVPCAGTARAATVTHAPLPPRHRTWSTQPPAP
ncbi:unnamed protein product [Arctia plantaginis]|uniref:Uncharacterized protein n=1 Tax=Arctia plantaginis TaxID=874455 RepID=A0A8S1ATC6_ARCPL|nr:unnamed protein product [Arctia plantaginis]CAB3249950.1 unnamed protein product [Arctia plantaginis]CAB3260713.1 unnamed protein product [Arctia plantaginis]